MDIRQERFIEQHSQQATYRLLEFNAAETYNRISLFDNEFKIVSTPREVFYGVTLNNISTIDKTIDTSKNIITKI